MCEARKVVSANIIRRALANVCHAEKRTKQQYITTVLGTFFSVTDVKLQGQTSFLAIEHEKDKWVTLKQERCPIEIFKRNNIDSS